MFGQYSTQEIYLGHCMYVEVNTLCKNSYYGLFDMVTDIEHILVPYKHIQCYTQQHAATPLYSSLVCI